MSTIINDATKKLSPFKKLTPEQKQLEEQILLFTKKHLGEQKTGILTVYGDAGTGKSVLLAHLFYQIQRQARRQKDSSLYGSNNCFLVNHPELLKVYRQIAGQLPLLYKKDFQRPTSFINQADKKDRTADIVVVDEAHCFYHAQIPTTILPTITNCRKLLTAQE